MRLYKLICFPVIAIIASVTVSYFTFENRNYRYLLEHETDLVNSFSKILHFKISTDSEIPKNFSEISAHIWSFLFIEPEMYPVFLNTSNVVSFARTYQQNVTFGNNSFLFFTIGSNDTVKLPYEFWYINIFVILITLSCSMTYLYYRKLREVTIIDNKYEFISKMLGYINHEIRNPLNAIKGLINIVIYDLEELSTRTGIGIGNGNVDGSIGSNESALAPIISNLHTANNTSDLLNHIVNDILDIQKLQKNKLAINYTKFSVTELKHKLYKILQFKLNENPEINYSFESDISYIYGDELRILQILINFTTNSIKFTESGELKVRIKKRNNYIRFEVSDNGRGIPEADKPRIFTPYEHIEISDSIRHGGVGLGLFLCKMLVEIMDGHIGFESIERVETMFWFEIK